MEAITAKNNVMFEVRDTAPEKGEVQRCLACGGPLGNRWTKHYSRDRSIVVGYHDTDKCRPVRMGD